MVFLTTQSENRGKEIALCLNTCRWTGFFGILHRMRHASNALKKRQTSRIHRKRSDLQRDRCSVQLHCLLPRRA